MELLKPVQKKRINCKAVLQIWPWLLFLPFMLGNKGCDKTFTWGDINKDVVAQWEQDHKDIDKDTKCVDCHDNRTTKTKPASHDISWTHEHGKYAQLKFGFRDENVCRLCHTESSCSQCHQIEEPENHTMFWKLRGHGVMVGQDRSKCAACHTATDFCERCHSEDRPTSHTPSWGSTTNNHCLSCHAPLNSAGGQVCAVCHASTPTHDQAPNRPNNALHVAGADCRGCHNPLRHQDNGMSCTSCHAQ